MDSTVRMQANACRSLVFTVLLLAAMLAPWVAQAAVQTLIEEARALRLENPQRAADLLAEARDQAEATADREALIEVAKLSARLAVTAADYETGLTQVEGILDSQAQAWTIAQRAQLTLLQANLLRQMGDRDKAWDLLQDLTDTMRGVLADEEVLVGQWLMTLGNLHHQRTEYAQAVDAYLQAQRLFRRANDASSLINGLIDLGITYERSRDLDAALAVFEEAKALIDESEDPELALRLNANAGITYQALGRVEEAVAAYQRGAELAGQLGARLSQAQALLNIGTVYFGDEAYEQALDYYQRSLEICEQHGLSYGILLNRINIGESFSRMGDYDQAIPALEAALAQAEASELRLEQRQALRNLSRAYQGAGQFEKALKLRDQYDVINEEIFNESRDRAISALRIEFETELKEQALLTQQAELGRSRAVNRLLIAVVGFGLGVIVLLVVVYRNRIDSMRALYERNRELMDSQFGPMPRRQAVYEVDGDDEEDSTEANESTDEDARLRQIYERLTDAMRTQELYRNPGLTVTDLAQAIASNRRYVSAAISRFGPGHFSVFVNFFRINEARRRLASAETAPSIPELIEACGFTSRSVFYEAFRKAVGMTPKQFHSLSVEERNQTPGG